MDFSHPMTVTPRLPVEEPLDPQLLARYRVATPEAKLAVVARLNATLIGLKEAQLAATCGELSLPARRLKLRNWWLGTRD
ncbi:MAG: hypothetical protein HYV95_13230 [Opitutae bacterium]|nr:hypothetical protein [Opitutae bacterium]